MIKPSFPSNWKRVRLMDYARIVSGATPKTSEPRYWNGNVPWVTPKDISDLDGYPFLETTPRKLTEIGLSSCSAEVLPLNSVLLSSRAPIGLVAINRIPAATNQGFKSFVPDADRLDPGFLYHWLRGNRDFLESLGTGATFKEISKAVVSRIEIPLPPIDDQKRIAAILDKADALRRQRQETLQLIEKLLQSVFQDMFGDLAGVKAQSYTFSELALTGRGLFSNGPFGSDLLTSELRDTGVPVIYIRDIRNGEFTWKSNVFVTLQKAKTLPSCEVKPNDLLIAKVGDPPGIAALYSAGLESAIITQDVIRARINTKIAHPIFLQHYLNSSSGRHLMRTITVKGTRSRFSLRDLKNLRIPVPPLELQEKFATVVTRITQLRDTSRESGKLLDQCFSSLQQRAFRGALDLSLLELSAPQNLAIESAPAKLITKVKRRKEKSGFLQAPNTIEAILKELDGIVRKGEAIPWSVNFFKYRILGTLPAPFSFSQVMQKAASVFDETPPYDEIKEIILSLLGYGDGHVLLRQRFDEARREIVLEPAS
jgi:type I restriction enzyme S subunit